MPKKIAAPRLTREQTRAQTKNRLIEAAGRVVARKGFGAASVDEIAAEAGYSRGAFYWNFTSKEAILLELLWRHMDQEITEIGALLEATASPSDVMPRLALWAETFHADADWALLAAELQLLAARDPEFAVAYEECQAKHRAALANFLTQLFTMVGKQIPMPSNDLALILKALVHGLALRNAARHDREGHNHNARLLLTLFQTLLAEAQTA